MRFSIEVELADGKFYRFATHGLTPEALHLQRVMASETVTDVEYFEALLPLAAQCLEPFHKAEELVGLAALILPYGPARNIHKVLSAIRGRKWEPPVEEPENPTPGSTPEKA